MKSAARVGLWIGKMQGRKATIILRFTHATGVLGVALWAPFAFGQYSLERKFVHGTDASAHHLFLINPASVLSSGMEVDAVIGRGTYTSSLEANRGGNINKRTTDGQDDFLAAGVLTDLGAGLSIGVNHLRAFHHGGTSDDNVRTPREEGRATQLTMARAAVQITQSLNLGIAIRHLEVEQNILGAMFVPASNNTVYKGSLFGTGGGLNLLLGQVDIALAYFPPLKGKSEIYGEEKIITEPGLSEAAASLTNGNHSYGIAMRRAIYKEDDRVSGTTLNDDNQTQINLFGLDPDETTVFFLEHYQFGVDLKLSDKTTARISLARETVEFNFDLEGDLPGQNLNAPRYNYYRAGGALTMKAAKFVLNLGANFVVKDHSFSRGNDNKFDYKSQGRDLFAVISTGL